MMRGRNSAPGTFHGVSWSLVLSSLFLMALLFVANSNFAVAQVSASISGRIEDPSGAAIPAASVTVTNLETSATRAVAADEAGNYRVLSLPVGRYEVRAEKAGFKAKVQTGINLVVGQEAVVTLRLEVGEVQQQVTVTAEAPLVNTTTASVAGLVGEQQVKDLPLNGRSFDNLITLNPGAVNYSEMRTSGANGTGNNFSVAGRRPTDNLFLLNGVEYTGASAQNMSPGGVSGQLLGIDAIREFNVVTNAYSAEYGKRTGAQVSVVTQSGTNHLHGSLFEFLRNSDLDARNFFDQRSVPPFKRNQFGGSAGGPIRKDKMFVFGSYEGFRQRLGLSNVTIVPDLNARRGLLPNAQGVPTPVAGLNPAMLPYMVFWPEPNGPNLGQGIAEAFSNPNQSIREDFGTMRFDQTFSGRDSLSAVYTVDDGISLTPNSNPLSGRFIALRMQVASMQETHIFSPQAINTFTAGFSHAGFAVMEQPLVPLPSNLSMVAGAPQGIITVGGGSVTGGSAITSVGGSTGPNAYVRRSLFTYADGVQVFKGKHRVSAGVWFQQLRSNEFLVTRPWGQALFATLPSFLQGTVGTLTIAPNGIPLAWRSLEGAWYLQDSIQLRPNLAFSLGVRHEFTNGFNEATGRAAVFQYDPSGVLLTNPTLQKSMFTGNNMKWLFGPRVGLAWDPFGKGKTSIRAGFGTSYNFWDSSGTWLSSVPPFSGAATFSNAPFLSIVPMIPGTPLPPSCGPGVPSPCTIYTPKGVQPSMKLPTVHSWNFTVEQQLTPGMALRVAYVGSRGTHGLISVDDNAIHAQVCSSPAGCTSGGVGTARGTVPQGAEYIPVGTRPNPYLAAGTFLFSEGNSSYNALQVEVTRRFSQGLQFRGNYTWAKNLDITAATTVSSGLNESSFVLSPYNPGRDWGPSAMNIAHQASGSFGYELPFGRGKPWLKGVTGVSDKLASGWQVNGIFTFLSGFPFTPQAGSNRSGDGNTANPDRPSVNPAFTGPVIIGSPNRWFNPNAFVLPTAGTYGNLGRGTLTGPRLATLDFSLFKNTKISERVDLQFRAELFNTLNHANFGNLNMAAFSGTAINPSAGVVTNTATTSRQIQFGLKLIF